MHGSSACNRAVFSRMEHQALSCSAMCRQNIFTPATISLRHLCRYGPAAHLVAAQVSEIAVASVLSPWAEPDCWPVPLEPAAFHPSLQSFRCPCRAGKNEWHIAGASAAAVQNARTYSCAAWLPCSQMEIAGERHPWSGRAHESRSCPSAAPRSTRGCNRASEQAPEHPWPRRRQQT